MELVAQPVEVPHTHFTKIPWMVLVKEDPMVVHTSGVSATAWMLSVLADTPMPGTDVATLLAILLEPRRHESLSLCPPRVSEERLTRSEMEVPARVSLKNNIYYVGKGVYLERRRRLQGERRGENGRWNAAFSFLFWAVGNVESPPGNWLLRLENGSTIVRVGLT